ncbi:hypothetical protein RND81_03G193700 [Saponaria officinalis]|uniref:RING-type E3 ubiquitin transferase n=1 Tax=Saponaria officinalis TaxID=3572 RepID=A0AAW1M5H9_SAPOF
MIRRELDSSFSDQSSADTSPSSSTSSSDVSLLITVLIVAIAIILSASLYLLLRFLRRNRISDNVTTTTTTLPHSLSSSSEKSLCQVSPIVDALPLFTYDNIAGKSAGDCAVCLSKFEKDDVLRLLPICCHAFHAECIDTWLSANLTCPLCRSPILMSDNDVIEKLVGGEERSRSFRVEIGNVSNRQRGSSAVNSGEIRRSYSLGGSFDYVISAGDDAIADLTSTGSFRQTSENYKEADYTAEERGALAAEVGTRGGVGGWLKDYLSYSLSSSSRTASFRNSGRLFFTGSSRRSTVELPVVNRENELSELDGASRLGDEIGELFRWLSGA